MKKKITLTNITYNQLHKGHNLKLDVYYFCDIHNY